MGVILCPLTPLGVRFNGRRLVQCSPSCCIIPGPITEISAPESGSAASVAWQFNVEIIMYLNCWSRFNIWSLLEFGGLNSRP